MGRSFLGGLISLAFKATLAMILFMVVVSFFAGKKPVSGGPQTTAVAAAEASSPATVATTPATAPVRTIQVGDEAVVDVPGATNVFLAVGDDSWDPMIDAENHNDFEEIGLLIAKGKVIRENNGVRVKLIKTGFLSQKVRIRSGENPGVEAWIQTEFVKPAL